MHLDWCTWARCGCGFGRRVPHGENHLGLRAHVAHAGSIFDWRIPIGNIWVCKVIPSLMIASCSLVLTWNPWENHVKKANVQGRGFRMKGETAYIVSHVPSRPMLLLTICPTDLANHRVVFTDIDLYCIVPGRHRPIEGLPRPSSRGSQLWSPSRVVNFTFLFFCFFNI